LLPAIAMPPRSSPDEVACSIATQLVAVSAVIWNCDVNGSSTAPLQLSSTELHVSVAGTTSPGHVVPHEPAAQVCVPARHAPTPDVPDGPE